MKCFENDILAFRQHHCSLLRKEASVKRQRDARDPRCFIAGQQVEYREDETSIMQ